MCRSQRPVRGNLDGRGARRPGKIDGAVTEGPDDGAAGDCVEGVVADGVEDAVPDGVVVEVEVGVPVGAEVGVVEEDGVGEDLVARAVSQCSGVVGWSMKRISPMSPKKPLSMAPP